MEAETEAGEPAMTADDALMEARELTMTTDEALRFLVRLAQTDITRIKRGDLLNLIDGLREYLCVSGDGRTAAELQLAENDPKRLEPTIETVRQVVEAIADRKAVHLSYGKGAYLIDATGPRPLSAEDASLRDNVLHAAAGDIDCERAARIRRCPRCGVVFYGQPNAVFCSRNCAAAEAVRRYRSRKEARQRKSRRN
jgi:hypothetical protein